MLLVLLQDVLSVPWEKLFTGSISFVILVLLLVVLVKLAPMYKEIKLREIDSRDKDSEARVAQSQALESVSTILYAVAVEQRRAGDSVKILQRVNTTKAEDLEAAVSEVLDNHEKRLSKVETNAHSITANPAAAH